MAQSKYPRVFVSYPHTDMQWATEFAHTLEQIGFAVWLDQDKISAHLGGDELKTQLRDAAQEHDVTVVVITDDAWESEWIQYERFASSLHGVMWILRGDKISASTVQQIEQVISPKAMEQQARRGIPGALTLGVTCLVNARNKGGGQAAFALRNVLLDMARFPDSPMRRMNNYMYLFRHGVNIFRTKLTTPRIVDLGDA